MHPRTSPERIVTIRRKDAVDVGPFLNITVHDTTRYIDLIVFMRNDN